MQTHTHMNELTISTFRHINRRYFIEARHLQITKSMISARLCLTICLALLVTSLCSSGGSHAFAPGPPRTTAATMSSSSTTSRSSSASRRGASLSERRWNFNEGQSPWGLKKNAEIWNGRVAQVRQLLMVWMRHELVLRLRCTLAAAS